MKIDMNAIRILENAFGFKFAEWQIFYLMLEGVMPPTTVGRANSRMLTLCIKLLLEDRSDDPVTMEELDPSIRDYVSQINDILIKAGFETNLKTEGNQK